MTMMPRSVAVRSERTMTEKLSVMFRNRKRKDVGKGKTEEDHSSITEEEESNNKDESNRKRMDLVVEAQEEVESNKKRKYVGMVKTDKEEEEHSSITEEEEEEEEEEEDSSITEEEDEDEEHSSIQIGDTLNLSDLLFTNKRNYLITYNNNKAKIKRVKAEDLAGKFILLHFMSLESYMGTWRTVMTNFLDIYTKLQPRGGFEIVFVVIGSTPRKCFLERFSTVPWPAIPFSDLKSRKRLERVFGISPDAYLPCSFIIDPRGVVLQSQATPLLLRYGAEAYPFTNERIEFLDSEDNLVQRQPLSVQKLLASPQRDYLINNKRDRVPLHILDDKVVGLFFCPCLSYHQYFTNKLKMVYEELSKNRKDFEIVLIYMRGWYVDYDEDSFLDAFKRMPWLALPFKDTNCNKKLQRIFTDPEELLWPEAEPRLVIIGPHGKFIEPLGGNILLKYGVPAYPFTLFSAVNLELKRAKEPKPEMFWDLNAVFTKNNGSQVRFSQLLGKRIIVLVQGYTFIFDFTLRELKARYFKMKGTDDEFEVIHILDERWAKQPAAPMPWLMQPPFDVESYAGKYIHRLFYHGFGVLAFDRDGSVVGRTRAPKFGDSMVFPFYHNGGLDNEVLLEVKKNIRFEIGVDDDGIRL